MLFTLVIGLYTSRVTLEILGVNDFGIYNVVGGIILVSNFISNAMALSVNRFLAYNLGLGSTRKIQAVFSMAINIHIIIAVLIFILGETVGLWFVNTQLVIPPERVAAALVVYHCSILSFALAIIAIPFNSAIIANEDMNFFALIGILQSIMKLVIVFTLPLIPFDRLSAYGILMMLPGIIYFVMNFGFVRKKYALFRYRREWSRSLFLQMTKFAGFSTFGNMATAIVSQGQSVLLNIFFGAALNAARGLSLQVNTAICQFANSIYTAVNPQIIKSYAQKDTKMFESIVFYSTLASYYMLFILCLPVILETDAVLGIWLKNVPDYLPIFIKLVLANTLVYNFVTPSWMALQATGKVQRIHLTTGTINLMNLLITYFLWRLYKMPPYTIWIVNISVSLMMQIATVIIQKQQTGIGIRRYTRNVVLPAALSSAIAAIVPVSVCLCMESGAARFILCITLSTMSCLASFYFIGIDRNLRQYIVSAVKSRLNISSNGKQ